MYTTSNCVRKAPLRHAETPERQSEASERHGDELKLSFVREVSFAGSVAI